MRGDYIHEMSEEFENPKKTRRRAQITGIWKCSCLKLQASTETVRQLNLAILFIFTTVDISSKMSKVSKCEKRIRFFGAR